MVTQCEWIESAGVDASWMRSVLLGALRAFKHARWTAADLIEASKSDPVLSSAMMLLFADRHGGVTPRAVGLALRSASNQKFFDVRVARSSFGHNHVATWRVLEET